MTANSTKTFEAFPIWGDVCRVDGRELEYDEDSQSFFDDDDALREVQELRSFKCIKCPAPSFQARTLKELRTHLTLRHKVRSRPAQRANVPALTRVAEGRWLRATFVSRIARCSRRSLSCLRRRTFVCTSGMATRMAGRSRGIRSASSAISACMMTMHCGHICVNHITRAIYVSGIVGLRMNF
jgi:hypothetical protein